MDLVKQVTSEEIQNALMGIGDNNSPGHDGFNALFFKKAWPVIGHDVTDAILDYFTTGKVRHEVNCTSITLIPKVKTLSQLNNIDPSFVAFSTRLYLRS